MADSKSLNAANAAVEEGSTAAWDFPSVFRDHYPYVVRLPASLTGDVEPAEDIAQDVFVAVFRGLRKFRGESSLRTWIYQITLRTSGRHAVKRKEQRAATDLALDFDELPGSDSAESAASLADVATAFAELPLESRIVLSLVAIEGLSHEAAAEVLGIPVGTLWSRLHTARRKLAFALDSRAPRKP